MLVRTGATRKCDAPEWSSLRIQMTQTNSEGSSENGDNDAGEVEASGAGKGRFGYNPRLMATANRKWARLVSNQR